VFLGRLATNTSGVSHDDSHHNTNESLQAVKRIKAGKIDRKLTADDLIVTLLELSEHEKYSRR
jgi:hypothetical protein